MKRILFTLVLGLLAGLAPSMAGSVPSGTNYTGLNKGQVEKNYRHREFRAYMPIDELRRRAKVKNYSVFENPTGIFFSDGEKVTLTLKGSADQQIKLIVHDFEKDGKHAEYALKEGKNTLTIQHKGLGYLDYRSTDPQQAPAVHVDIQGGKVNGVFTRDDDDATWKRLLAEAKCNILDLLGERVQLAYDVEGLKKGCPNDGSKMLAMYDDIMRMEQDDIMGWDRDHTHTGNHIHGRVQWGGFMHADGIGAAFIFSAIPGITNIEGLRKGSWGVAHEFGHVNQTRPGMMWVGTAEVTNNIYSAWVNYCLNPERMRLEHEVIANADNERMMGGRFDSYINNAFVRRRLWQYHGGPDGNGNLVPPGDHPGDHFVSVCPLWQLQLYIAVARGNKNFYPNIYHDVRVTDESKMTNGELRVLFFKRACDSAQLDLTDFFVKTGILAPMNRWVKDYGSAYMTITKEMCDEAISYASRYPKPDTTAIYYITANTVGIYRDKLNIRKPESPVDLKIVNGRLEIAADQWENAVAFEAYQGKNLLRTSLRGLNHEDKSSTTVICPEGTDTVKAVQWDGKRLTILKIQDKEQ